MNKKILTVLSMSLLLVATACNNTNLSISENKEDVEVSLLAPSGTPLLAMSNYITENELVKYEVAKGSDPLIAAFTSKSHDIIVAPINLGANFYNKTGNYVLFETIVWGNLYVVSHNPISSFSDLNNKDITIFGTNQTPDIIMKTLASENNITYNKDLVSDVELANEKFASGLCDYAVSAEPSLSKLKQTVEDLYVLDLQAEWQKITGSSSYPQAAVFVNKDKVDSLSYELEKIETSINTILDDLDYSTSCALKTPLKFLGETTIKSALPNSHIGIEENQKEAIEFYFNKLFTLELGNTFGGKLPDENFYL